MKILVVGSGGREHALGWKLTQSPLVSELISAPGNPGLAELGRTIALKADNARELAELLTGIPCKVNLIPFNAWEGSGYECSLPERISAFAAILEEQGYDAPVRRPRGRDILAACGQLKSESQRAKKAAE